MDLHFRWYEISGISLAARLSSSSSIGLKFRISADLTSDFQDCKSFKVDNSPQSSVQCIIQSVRYRFFGGSSIISFPKIVKNGGKKAILTAFIANVLQINL